MNTVIVRCIFLVVFLFSGIVRASDSSDMILVKGMKITVEDEDGNGNGNEENFESFYSQYIGQTISIEDLGNKIHKHFTDQDYFYPQITISREGLEEGFVFAYVRFTYIGNITIDMGKKDNALIDEYINKILNEKRAKTKTIQKYIALMNRIPGCNVQYEFIDSKEKGAIDIVLSINQSKALVYASSDSYGSNDYGKMQNVLSAQMFSPFGGGNDSWTTYGVTTNHPDRLYVVGAGYNRIINNYGTSFDIIGSYSRDNSTYNDVISTKDGVSESYGASFTHPLYLDSTQTLEGTFGTTYNYSKGYTADVNILKQTARGQKLSSRVNIFSRPDTLNEYWSSNAGLNYLGSDKAGGYNNINLQFSQGIGGKFQNYSDLEDVPEEHYNVMTINVYREQNLSNNFFLVSNMMAGRSDYDLPSQELFALGGRDFGRGYESGILSGNKLIAASLELRYNKEMEDDPLFSLIQPYIFRDMGYVGKQSSSTSISHLSSYGGGIRFFLTHDAQINLEIAQPLQNFYTIDGIKYEPKAIIGIMGSKVFRF